MLSAQSERFRKDKCNQETDEVADNRSIKRTHDYNFYGEDLAE